MALAIARSVEKFPLCPSTEENKASNSSSEEKKIIKCFTLDKNDNELRNDYFVLITLLGLIMFYSRKYFKIHYLTHCPF